MERNPQLSIGEERSSPALSTPTLSSPVSFQSPLSRSYSQGSVESNLRSSLSIDTDGISVLNLSEVTGDLQQITILPKKVGTNIQITNSTGTFDLPLIKILGSGLESTVFEIEFQGRSAVLKQITDIRRGQLENAIIIHFMASNIRANHPNIISLYGIICSESIKAAVKATPLQIPEDIFFASTDTGEYCYLVFENIIGTSLYQFPNKQPIFPLISQLFAGLTHLHQLGIAHRDIKPDNVMVSPEGQLKIIDLGISCIIGTCVNNSFTPAYTMVKYMVGSNIIKNSLAFNNDIYASLLLIYFLASDGRTKFVSNEGFQQNTNIRYEKIPEKYREFLKRQINSLTSITARSLDREGSIKKMNEIFEELHTIETSGGKKRYRKTKRRYKLRRTKRLLKHRL